MVYMIDEWQSKAAEHALVVAHLGGVPEPQCHVHMLCFTGVQPWPYAYGACVAESGMYAHVSGPDESQSTQAENSKFIMENPIWLRILIKIHLGTLVRR